MKRPRVLKRINRRKILSAGLLGGFFTLLDMVFEKRLGGAALANAGKRSQSDVLEAWLAASEERIRLSPQFRDGKFRNRLVAKEDLWGALRKWATDSKTQKTPTDKVPTLERKKQDFDVAPLTKFRVTWLGHSSILIEMDGKTFLTDPVWGERASPVAFAGPKRFFDPPLALDQLPRIDAILLSHDHYDHMCSETVAWLRDQRVPFVTTLGVGQRLVKLGVDPLLVHEHDWWETNGVFGPRIVCTPARHFSGRSLWDRDKTLWCSWTVIGSEHRFFFSGDTAMFEGFKEIGEKYGPFDLVAMEAGAYNSAWPDVHIGPEQAIQASIDLGAKVVMPIHWGTFPLALHAWTEPAERIQLAAQMRDLALALPMPGQSFEPSEIDTLPKDKWWPHVAWETADVSPIVSSGLDSGALTRAP